MAKEARDEDKTRLVAIGELLPVKRQLLEFTIKGVRPGAKESSRTGLAINTIDMDKRDYLMHFRAALMALYKHELRSLGWDWIPIAGETQMFDIELQTMTGEENANNS